MGFHLLILCTMLSSPMRSIWPNQFSLCFFNNPYYILSCCFVVVNMFRSVLLQRYDYFKVYGVLQISIYIKPISLCIKLRTVMPKDGRIDRNIWHALLYKIKLFLTVKYIIIIVVIIINEKYCCLCAPPSTVVTT
jgi:hypothetical protein